MSSIKVKTAIPGPKSVALMERRRREVPRGPFHVAPVFMDQGNGATMTDVDGNVYLDFATGIGVNVLGHRAEKVVGGIKEQLDRFLHGSFNVTPYESYILLSERLNKLTPGNFAKKTFLANSGAEAVENAIKVARAFTHRNSVVCFDHAFHGRTYMAMSLTSKAKPYKYGFSPFCSDILRVPFPYCYRWPSSSDPEKVSSECFKQFEESITQWVSPTEIAAIIIEPVLGEGGFVPAPKVFLSKLRQFATTNGIVLIADEIQSGFGRTGTLFASEQLDLIPDLILTAKGLGGGLPLSAVTGKAEMMDAPIEGGIGGTYGGNPVAIAAALGVLDTFEDSKLLKRARELGEKLKGRLQEISKKCEFVGDVRGLGPMQAVEFVKDRTTKEPYPEFAKACVQKCIERGLIVMTAGSYGNVVRFLLPLVMTDSELEEGLSVFEGSLVR